MRVGIRMLELGARGTGSLASRLARAQFPGGLRGECRRGAPPDFGTPAGQSAGGLPASPLPRKFGALEESCASGEPSGGEGPEGSVRRSLAGRADPTRGKSRIARPARP